MIPATPGTPTEPGTAMAEPSAGSPASPAEIEIERDPQPTLTATIRLPEPAAIVSSSTSEPTDSNPAALPLSFLAHLLRQLSSLNLDRLTDLLPALKILAIALVAGLALRITGAVLGSLNEIPLLGGLLELVGLIRFIQLVSRHALRHQKRAELLARIQSLKASLLG